MVYTINVADVKNRELENAPKNLLATVTVEFDNILKISGISIKEKADGMLYVEMPKRANYYSRSVINSRTKYIAIPSNKEFAKELYSNIIKTYVDGAYQFISNVGEPEQTHYKINAYPSGTIDCDGIINIELEDSVKIRGLRLINNNGVYSVICPVNSNDYLNWQLPSIHMEDDFLEHVIKNSLSMIEEIKMEPLSSEERAEIKDIDKKINNEQHNIRTCERMSAKICEDLEEIDDSLENDMLSDEDKEKLLSKQNYLNNMLGQFAYSFYVTDNKLKELDKQKQEIMLKSRTNSAPVERSSKKKAGVGR